MIIVNKQTLETFTPQELSESTPHIWDFTEDLYIQEMLQTNGFDIVEMSEPPFCDYDFYKLKVVNVRKDGIYYKADWGLEVIPQDIDTIASKKLSQIKYQCEKGITSGFHSAALGGTYFYSSDLESQANIQGNILFSTIAGDTKHICYDASGNRLILPHTKEQMIQVGRDFSLHLWDNLEKYHAKRLAIELAKDCNELEEIISITWN